jgi:hypothetical protein
VQSRAYRGTRILRAVQTLLGRASIATPERYTAVDVNDFRAAMMAAKHGWRREPQASCAGPRPLARWPLGLRLGQPTFQPRDCSWCLAIASASC